VLGFLVAPSAPPVLLAAPNMPAKKQSKSAFIRKQPATLSAAEVVAKAKAAGIKFTTQLVYNVRGGSKAKKAVAKTTRANPVAVVTSKSPVTASKADFVRAHANLSPKEIVAKAKGEGVKFDVSYVYRVRGYDKTAGKKKRDGAKPRTARAGAPVPRPITNRSSAEDLLRAVAAEVGLGRAIELLQGERARVHSILRG
jgi:hypothetical protein